MLGLIRRAAVLVAASWALMAAGGTALAEKRVALVIGNSAYRSVAALPNPANDARLLKTGLEATGFEVMIAENLDHDAFLATLRAFRDKVDDADWAMVYYAGHGLEIAGTNYLVPVDAKLLQDRDVLFEAISMDQVMAAMDGARALRMIVLDACRNNPFLATMRRSGATSRDVSRGLARIEPTQATLVVYSAKAGTTAVDGNGANSPFAVALSKRLSEPGLEVTKLFRLVRDDVFEATAQQQEPFTYGSLPGRLDFFFRQPAAGPSPAGDPIAADYQAASQLNTGAGWDAFLRKYQASQPDNFYVTLAKDAVVKLAALPPRVLPPAQPIAPVPPDQVVCAGVVASVGTAGVAAAAQRCLKAKDSFRDCADVCPEMVVIPPGLFTMGSPAAEKDRDADEGPARPVNVPAAFAVGKLEITRGQFVAFLNDSGYRPAADCISFSPNTSIASTANRSVRDAGIPQTDSHPAVCISWNDAKAYVAWLAKKTAKPYRLLSEAEFEYAARAGKTQAFGAVADAAEICGGINGADVTYKAQFPGWTGPTTCSDNVVFTAPAGSLAPNDFGLFDMAGNASEWTEDCYHDSYTGAPKDASAWISGECKSRVLRGGGWQSGPRFLRSADRSPSTPTSRTNMYGFRVARSLAP